MYERNTSENRKQNLSAFMWLHMYFLKIVQTHESTQAPFPVFTVVFFFHICNHTFCCYSFHAYI